MQKNSLEQKNWINTNWSKDQVISSDDHSSQSKESNNGCE